MSFFQSVRFAPRHARASALPAAAQLAIVVIASTCAGALAQSTLPPITVTATRFAQPAAELPFGVSVLTAEQLRIAGVTTVNEAVMRLLGVPGRQDFYGGGDYSLDLRGFGGAADNNQVVVVDGIRMNEADLGGTRLAGLSIDSIERIEVIRGSGAVLYGEGATGGVIVITTKAGQGVMRNNGADAYVGAGSYGVREARGTATVLAGDFSLDTAVNQRDADNDRDNFRSKTDGASLAGQWRNEWVRIGVRHAYDHLDTGLPGSLTDAQYADDPHQTKTPLDHATIRNSRSSVFGEATLGAWQIGLDAGWRDKSLRSSSSGFDYAYDVDASTYAVRAKHAARVDGLANSFVAGVDHGRWQRNVLGAFGSQANQRSQAYYLKDELTFAGGTRISAGWRTERIDKDNSSSVATGVDQRPNAWEFGLVQPLGGGVSIYGRYGRSFRLANVDEFGFTSPNAVLRTQTSRDSELGARWSYDGGRAELRFYRSALNDEIGYDPSAMAPSGLGANVNFDPTRRQGIELEVTQALASNANLRVNAAARRARFSGGPHGDNDVPLTPRHTLSVRTDWSPSTGHRVDADVAFVSSQSPDFDSACRMPAYVTADLRYAYQWRIAEFAVGVGNLTDRKYYTQAFSCSAGVVSSIYPEAGRAVTASVRLHF